MEEDVIEDSSPVRNKFSEYRPVDRKANKYFMLDQEEEDVDRRKHKERAMQVPGRGIEPAQSRFNERKEPGSQSRNRI